MPKTAEGAKALYDNWAAGYDDALASWGYPAPGRVADTLLECGADTAAPAADLGCGTGLAGTALRTRGFTGDLVGVDISAESLRVAEATRPGVYTELVSGNLDDGLPFLPSSTFGAVVSVGVLSYVEHFPALFDGAARVAAPGGLVCVTHRAELWDDDVRGVRTAAAALTERSAWKLVHLGEPEAYMPLNPDPAESAKTIRIICWRVLAGAGDT